MKTSDAGEAACTVIENVLAESQIAAALSAPDGRIMWVNAALCTLLARSPAQMLDGTWLDLTHPEDIVNDSHFLSEIESGRRSSYRLRKRFLRSNGVGVPVSLTVTCLRDPGGQVVAYLGQVVSLVEELELHHELLRSWDRLGAAVEAGIDPMVICDVVRDEEGQLFDLRIAVASRAVEKFAGRPISRLTGTSLDVVFPGYRQSGWRDTLFKVLQEGNPLHVPLIQASTLFHSPPRWLEYQAARVDDGIAITWRDVTEAYEATQADIRTANERYRMMIDNSADVVFHTVKGIVEWVSPSCKSVLGWPAEALLGHPTTSYWHPDDLAMAIRLRDATYAGRVGQGVLRWRRPDDSYLWVEAVLRPVTEPDGGTGAVGSLRDVNDRVSIQNELNQLLGHDSLTGLGNRTSLTRLLEDMISGADGSRSWPALVCIGVDRLSLVNDAYGHAAGDYVLKVIASRLAAEADESTLLFRGSGVEFFVLSPSHGDIVGVGLLADRLRLSVRGPIGVGGRDVDMTASVGVALAFEGRGAEELIQGASLATRRAKEAGRDRVYFEDVQLTSLAKRHIEVLELARQGVADGRFRANWMPIVDLRTGTISGFEALARWEDADGLNDPAEFIPIMESSGLICELDLAIVHQALEIIGSLQAHQFVAVNISAQTLVNPGCVSMITSAITANPGHVRRLHLEITETSLLPASSEVARAMCSLSDIGVQWYVDDFGIGFSSISHLRDLPLSGLKLDKSFTAGIGRGDETCLRLAHALAGLAQGLELDTVAEGITSDTEAASLRAQGWRHGQGWLYSRAVGRDELPELQARFSHPQSDPASDG